MENKKSFVIHIDSLDVLNDLSAEQTKELVIAWRDYNMGLEPKLNGLMNAVFKSFKNQFDRDLEKYKKTVERNKGNGSKGGRPPKTQDNPKKPSGLIENPSKPKKADNDSVSDNDLYKNIRFIEITNFNDFISSFKLNKNYLKIARRFWKLWRLEKPKNKTLIDAKIINWYESIRLMIEVDNQSIERLICIYKYFEKCQQKDSTYSNFWFDQIMSVPAMRKTNDDGVYRLDMIMKDINEKIDKDDAFNRLVTDSINNFKNYTDECN